MDFPPLLPVTTDRDTRGFFEAAAEGRLVYRACNSCGHALHPPTALCPYCHGSDTEWRAAKGAGTLHSWTTVRHAAYPAYETPYTLVLVTLDDVPEVRLVGRLQGEPDLEPNMKMEVWFEKLGDGVVLPQWRPASG
jgi:uncharacterized OB-fold protein